MAVEIRRANRNDAPTIAEYALKLFAQHREYDARRFAEIASIEGATNFYGSRNDTEDAAVLIAELENEIVGFAYIEYERLDYANLLENAAWLHDLYVDERARKHHAGKLLIEKSIEVAREFGADKLMLSVAAKNEYAQEFFERQGFRRTMVEMMFDLTEQKGND